MDMEQGRHGRGRRLDGKYLVQGAVLRARRSHGEEARISIVGNISSKQDGKSRVAKSGRHVHAFHDSEL